MNLNFQHSTPSSKTVRLLRDNVLQFENPGAGFWVSVAPHPQARPSYCDENVALAIRDSGGEAVHVWDVTETGNFVEFEAHIIWKRPDGQLLDVSPSLIRASRHFVIPSVSPHVRPFPGSVMLSTANDPEARSFARYKTLANAILAPHLLPGMQNISMFDLRIWIADFVTGNRLDCDRNLLLTMCQVTLIERGGTSI